MPVRRRISKARPDELAMWAMLFTTGYDFFGDLSPLAYANEAEAQAAAPAAWKRLGAQFMRTWEPTVNTEIPWALTEFGEP